MQLLVCVCLFSKWKGKELPFETIVKTINCCVSVVFEALDCVSMWNDVECANSETCETQYIWSKSSKTLKLRERDYFVKESHLESNGRL